MTDSMDLSFNVTLPYGAVSNNATTVSKDGKTLTWTLTTQDASAIEFEFELYNMTTIYICVGVLAAIIILVVIIFVKKRNNKKMVGYGYASSQTIGQQPAMSDMEKNIGRDVYQSSLQSVGSVVEPQTTVVPSVQEQSVASNVQVVNVEPQMVEPTIQSSSSEGVQSIEPVVSQVETTNEVILNPVNQNETLNIDSNNQNMN